MRDMRLSFWSSIYGCAAALCVIASRVFSFYLQNDPSRLPRFADPLNYLLTLCGIFLLLRATGTAEASIRKLRTGKNLLTTIQVILVIDLLYLIAAQVLHFTAGIDVHNRPIVVVLATLCSLPTVCGLYALYFYKQLRSKMQYPVLGFFVLTVIWVLSRLIEKIIFPLTTQFTQLSELALKTMDIISKINNILSFIIYIIAMLGLSIYAYYCGKAAKKMPEKQY